MPQLKHYMSRHDYPTRIMAAGGATEIGHKTARAALERKLGRSLHANTKVKKKGHGGNWLFIEPSRPKKKD